MRNLTVPLLVCVVAAEQRRLATMLTPGSGPLALSDGNYLAPPGGCMASVTITGGGGGSGANFFPYIVGAAGGNAASFTATFWSDGVTPFTVVLATGGKSVVFVDANFGGGGGGGSTALLLGTTVLAVAGGGGGGSAFGGNAVGGDAGAPGFAGATAPDGNGCTGGGGGTQITAGEAGTGDSNYFSAATAGDGPVGGNGGISRDPYLSYAAAPIPGGTGWSVGGNGGSGGNFMTYDGGGGGAGYYGGGGGSSGVSDGVDGSGGGGGSSFALPTITVGATTFKGAGSTFTEGDDGRAVLESCDLPSPTPSVSPTASPTVSSSVTATLSNGATPSNTATVTSSPTGTVSTTQSPTPSSSFPASKLRVWRQFGGDHAKTGKSPFIAPANPTLRWKSTLGGGVMGSALVTVETGSPFEYLLMVTTSDGTLSALEPKTGDLTYVYPSTSLLRTPLPPIDANFIVAPYTFWVSSTEGDASVYDGSYNIILTSMSAGHPLREAPTYDGHLVWWSTADGYLITVDRFAHKTTFLIDLDCKRPTSVAIKLTFPAGSAFSATEPRTVDEGGWFGTELIYHIFVADSLGVLRAFNYGGFLLDSATWTETFSSPLWVVRGADLGSDWNKPSAPMSAPVYDAVTDRVFVTGGFGSRGMLISVHAVTGALQYYSGSRPWTIMYGEFTAPVLVDATKIAVILTESGWSKVLVFSKATGVLVCDAGGIGSKGFSAAPVVDAEGTIVFSDLAGDVYGVSSTCQNLWSISTPGPITTSVVIAPDGLFIGAKSTWAFTSCPANQEWNASGVACAACAANKIYAGATLGCALCAPGSIPDTATSCATCRSGSYAPFSGAIACVPCAAGSWEASVGQSSCRNLCAMGSYGLISGGTSIESCAPCPAGSYQNSQGASSCIAGPAGYYSNATGVSSSSLFTPCPAGTGSTASGLASVGQCLQCAAGTYQPLQAQQMCAACDPGSFLSSPGAVNASECLLCPPGTFSATAASTSCTPCSPGSASPVIGARVSSVCTLCEAGKAAAASGQSACSACATGYYAQSSGALACAAAPAGSFVSASGATAATPCAAGSANGLVGEAACVICAPGSFSPSSGALTCTVAPPGAFVSVSGATSTQPCPLGTFNSLSSQMSKDACVPCSPGSYAHAASSSRCSLCPAGRGSNGAGSTSLDECVPCPRGTFNSAPGQTLSACVVCPEGTSSDADGANSSATCRSCAAGSFADAGAIRCTLCPPGTFSASPQSATCTLCPLSTFGIATGATDAASCALCPSGTTTAVSGASTAAQCIAGAYTCAVGFGPISSKPPTSNASCVPLACARPLVLATDKSTCVGCAVNTSGIFPACSVCPTGSVCPGLTTVPLVPVLAFAAFAAACAPLTGAGRLVPVIPVTTPLPGYAWLTNILSVDNAIISGFFLHVICRRALHPRSHRVGAPHRRAAKIIRRLLSHAVVVCRQTSCSQAAAHRWHVYYTWRHDLHHACARARAPACG